MRFVLVCHSLLSDWNHGNAHFLRGVAVELQARGHVVDVYEARDAWSVTNLVADHGEAALEATRVAYPTVHVVRYGTSMEVERAIDGADVVIVHEWNPPELVARIGRARRQRRRPLLLFHDTHHRSVSRPEEMARYDLTDYDGVLAFGEAIRERYLANGWSRRVWTWHEAADVRVFGPHPAQEPLGDLVWVGNWGDGERRAELNEYLLGPVRQLRLRAAVHGVRYPPDAIDALGSAGLEYRGWTANYHVPALFARYRATVHVPRRPYAEALPGIPTIRPFEALACGIPLVCAPWCDAEGLFREGRDYLLARDGAEMARHLRAVLADPDLARALARAGRATILARHTCAHRVNELLTIVGALRGTATAQPVTQVAGLEAVG